MTEPINNNNRSIQLIRREMLNSPVSSQADTSHSTENTRSRKRTKSAEKPFGVKVRRRWKTAKESIFRHLNIYTEAEQLPLGMIIDYWA